MENILQQVKTQSNPQNQMIISLTNTIETKKLITEEGKYVKEAN